MPEATLDENVDLELEDDFDADDSETVEITEDLGEDEAEDLEEDEEEAPKKKKAKRPRKLFAEENVYVFNNLDDAKKTLEDEVLLYQDGSKVEGFRVWEILKKVELDKDGRRVDKTGELICAVLARTKMDAACTYAESRGFYFDLHGKKRRGGRSASKIPTTELVYGQMLSAMIFKKTYPHPISKLPVGDPSSKMKKDAHPQYVKQWNETFGVGGKCYHFMDAEGNWKEATDKDD